MSGRGPAVAIGVAFLTLWPAPSGGRAAAQRQPETRQVIDLGLCRLSPPPVGKWEINRDDEGGVTFVRDKGRTVISVSTRLLEVGDWRKTEAGAAEHHLKVIAGQAAHEKEAPREVGDKGEIDLKDKKLYYLKLQVSPAVESRTTDVVVYLYFPSPFRKLRMFVYFTLYCVRPNKGANPSLNPDLGALHAVVNSLEIADPLENVQGPEGVLIRAAAAGDAQAVREAIGRGTSANAKVSSFTALSAAAYFGHREIVDFLLDNGADINKTESGGITALHRAIWGDEPEIAAHLIERGANVNFQTELGFSALMFVAALGHLSLVSMLVEKGAEVDARDESGETALMLSTDGSAEVVRLLIAKGANPNVQIDDGWTPLMQAVFRENAEIARLLLDSGANANLGSVNGWTALMAAIATSSFKGNPGLVRLLIEKGADMDAQERDSGQGPLHMAIFARESDIARMLIGAGADVNLRLKSGKTPLILAAMSEQVEIVKLLIEKGADVNAMAEGNITALKAAAQKRNQEIVKLLQAAGAK